MADERDEFFAAAMHDHVIAVLKKFDPYIGATAKMIAIKMVEETLGKEDGA